jgi:hypothetical protein
MVEVATYFSSIASSFLFLFVTFLVPLSLIGAAAAAEDEEEEEEDKLAT